MSNRATGSYYERKAEDFLVSQGMEILDRNYYWTHGEIDLIAKDKDYLVFVEVKYRKDNRYGDPALAVDLRKQTRIRKGASLYMLKHRIPMDTPCRFDVISITEKEVCHYRNAF